MDFWSMIVFSEIIEKNLKKHIESHHLKHLKPTINKNTEIYSKNYQIKALQWNLLWFTG